MNDDVFDWDVSRLGLSARAYNSLWRSGHTTVGDIHRLNPRELYAVKNLGGLSLDELINTMRNLGFVDWAAAADRYRPKRPKRKTP